MELGKKIKQLRFKASLTQEQLAESVGVSAQAVSKWENSVAMPDIALLPKLAEIFGVSIDDLFDLTVEQRLNRIENRMDREDELPQDIFREYEDFLKTQLGDETYKKRATSLLACLYWHRMNAAAEKAGRYAREAVEENPGIRLPYYYLLDNLIADRRADEADACLERLSKLPDTRPVINEVYRAHIALARFDEKSADAIMERLVREHADDFACLFEAAQYYARKCDYDRAVALYERSFEAEPRRPRFTDELTAIADIWEIRGEYKKAAETYERVIALLENEWGMTEEVALKDAQREKARLLEKCRAR